MLLIKLKNLAAFVKLKFFPFVCFHVFFLIKAMILRFLVIMQLLSLVLRAEISLGLIGCVIRVDKFVEFLVLFAGIILEPSKQ